jgi:hypothetical protein
MGKKLIVLWIFCAIVAFAQGVTIKYSHPVTKQLQTVEMHRISAQPVVLHPDNCEPMAFPGTPTEGGFVTANCLPKGGIWQWGQINLHLVFNGHLVKKTANLFGVKWHKPIKRWSKDEEK